MRLEERCAVGISVELLQEAGEFFSVGLAPARVRSGCREFNARREQGRWVQMDRQAWHRIEANALLLTNLSGKFHDRVMFESGKISIDVISIEFEFIVDVLIISRQSRHDRRQFDPQVNSGNDFAPLNFRSNCRARLRKRWIDGGCDANQAEKRKPGPHTEQSALHNNSFDREIGAYLNLNRNRPE